jgi:hypothetical protein
VAVELPPELVDGQLQRLDLLLQRLARLVQGPHGLSLLFDQRVARLQFGLALIRSKRSKRFIEIEKEASRKKLFSRLARRTSAVVAWSGARVAPWPRRVWLHATFRRLRRRRA